MKIKFQIIITLLFLFDVSFVMAQPKLSLDLNKKGVSISPTHYGIFFEDINHAADGGLYAELIRNRSFEDATTAEYWNVITKSGGIGSISIETQNLLNSTQNKALKLNLSYASVNASVGIYNAGYWGLNVVNGNTYKLSFFAKSDANYSGDIKATLESSTGIKYAEATISGIDTGWKKFTCTLTAAGNNANARLVLSGNSVGTLWFDVVSLFPPTYKNRENGLRPELAQLLEDMKPKFMRFPGGCFVEGDYLANRFQWKNTIGNIEDRPGHYNLWGYRATDGLGYHEYLQFSEDISAEPLYVINVGLAHNDNQNYTNLSGYIQDALDAIEYANGPVTSTWGAKRAENGHPESFNLRFIEIGNENYFGDNYGNRYIQFYNAIHNKYPEIQLIGNVAAWGTDSPAWTFSHPVDLLDEHYYRSPDWFINQYKKYDSYSRNGAKIYVGEYAVTSGCGNGNLSAAIGEAVYMAGMEKNSDVVPLNSYAPIFVNVNDRKWNPDMICYNASTVYCTPSYYIQKLFANNIGTVDIPVVDTLNNIVTGIKGAVGVGTWATKAEYSDVSVVNESGTTLFSDQFSSDANWTAGTGNWNVAGNVYAQTSTSTDCRSIGQNITDSVFTYTLKAKKTSGNEGFLIIFGYTDANNFYWWNIGGWGNTQHAIEHCVDGSKSAVSTVNGSISTNVVYDVKIEVTKESISCYLNNSLIQKYDIPEKYKLYTSASIDENTKQLFVKVINPTASDITSEMVLKGLNQGEIYGDKTVLSSADVNDENTLTNPDLVTPVKTSFSSASSSFENSYKANSVTILKIDLNGLVSTISVSGQNEDLKIKPNPANSQIVVSDGSTNTIPLEIYNLTGQLLINKVVGQNQTVDISKLGKGIYFLKSSKNSNQTKKLIVN